MKASSKRRSAFGVYQSQLKKEDDAAEKEEQQTTKTPGAKKRRHEGNSSSRSSKKVSKFDSASRKSLNSDLDTNGNFDHGDDSPETTEFKQKGKGKLFSKANKLRQSLTLSSRKRKRHGYRSYDQVEKSESSVSLAVHSVPEKTECRTDSELGNAEAEQEDRLNSEQGETDADRLFSWLISPVKPGKFFRYM